LKFVTALSRLLTPLKFAVSVPDAVPAARVSDPTTGRVAVSGAAVEEERGIGRAPRMYPEPRPEAAAASACADAECLEACTPTG